MRNVPRRKRKGLKEEMKDEEGRERGGQKTQDRARSASGEAAARVKDLAAVQVQASGSMATSSEMPRPQTRSP